MIDETSTSQPLTRPSQSLSACVACGAVLPQFGKGPARRFCGDACRKRHGRSRKLGSSAPPQAIPARGEDRSAGAPAAPAAGLCEAPKTTPDTDPSWHHANNVSPLGTNAQVNGAKSQNLKAPDTSESEVDSPVRKSRRRERFALLDVIREYSTLPRVRKCGLVPNGQGGWAIKWKSGIGYWSGYCSCGSIHACPVCSGKIRVARAVEISRVAAAHIQAGGVAFMVSLTARHRGHLELEPLYDAIAKGWRRLISGKTWAGHKKRGHRGLKDKLNFTGYIRALEVTYGFKNGFHPHLHVLVLLDKEPKTEDYAAWIAHWSQTWQQWMVDLGYEAPSKERGIRWDRVVTAEEAGEYIAKLQERKSSLGNEMARGDMKKGRFETYAMFELVDYFRTTGDARVIPVWQEYEQGTFNRRAITWANGLRKKYLGDEPEISDADLAAAEQGGVVVAMGTSNEDAMYLASVPGLKAHLLEVLEEQGYVALVQEITALQLSGEVFFTDPGEDS